MWQVVNSSASARRHESEVFQSVSVFIYVFTILKSFLHLTCLWRDITVTWHLSHSSLTCSITKSVVIVENSSIEVDANVSALILDRSISHVKSTARQNVKNKMTLSNFQLHQNKLFSSKTYFSNQKRFFLEFWCPCFFRNYTSVADRSGQPSFSPLFWAGKTQIAHLANCKCAYLC